MSTWWELQRERKLLHFGERLLKQTFFYCLRHDAIKHSLEQHYILYVVPTFKYQLCVLCKDILIIFINSLIDMVLIEPLH